MTVAAILDELGAAPSLPGARCVDRHQLFDATIEGALPGMAGVADLAAVRAEAVRVCRSCPELEPCGRWLDRQPRRFKPLGVIAGRVIVGRTQASRNRKEPA